jgi:hypothetical protein
MPGSRCHSTLHALACSLTGSGATLLLAAIDPPQQPALSGAMCFLAGFIFMALWARRAA